MHTLIIGISGSGKTYFAKHLCANLRRKSAKNTLVMDIINDKWDCDFQTNNFQQFHDVLFSNINCHVFIDESGETIEKGKYDRLATLTRHYGHSVYFISQRAQQLSPTLRNMCTKFFVFRQNIDDCKIISRMAADNFMECAKLPKYHCLYKLDIDDSPKMMKV